MSNNIKIWYKALPVIPQIIWPIIDIDLSYKSQKLPQPILSLIDSGANTSILHPEIAQRLGFSSHNLGKPSLPGLSVSGAYRSWLLPENINVEIYGFSFSFRFQVIDNPDLIWPCILGENSIFQMARLDFQKYKGFFEISFRKDIN